MTKYFFKSRRHRDGNGAPDSNKHVLKIQGARVEPSAKMYSYLLQQRGMQQEVMSRHKVTKSGKN